MKGFNDMLCIDADAHVMEPEEAFAPKYFDPEYRERRPKIVEKDGDLYWMVDDELFPRLKGTKDLHYMGVPPRFKGVSHPFTRAKWINDSARELTDAKDRLAVMDQHGIDVQVLHTSFFFVYPTSWGGTDPKLGTAICRAYNRWMAERCAGSGGRLTWSAQVCLDDVEGAVQLVREAKELGAACAFVNGTVGERKLSSSLHYPFFEALCEHDVPMSVHIGWSFPPLTRMMDSLYEARVVSLIYPLLFGFTDVVSANLMKKFDTLRVAFLEGGCDWIPFVLDQMDNIYKVITQRLGWRARELDQLPTELIRECDRLFFNTEPEAELLPHVLEQIGNRFVLGSDMPHTETVDKRSKQLVLLQRTDLSDADKRKILEANPKAFFRVTAWDKMKPRALAALEAPTPA
jgi:predicted TIM-barrel fold metal-dependent hydrolase